MGFVRKKMIFSDVWEQKSHFWPKINFFCSNGKNVNFQLKLWQQKTRLLNCDSDGNSVGGLIIVWGPCPFVDICDKKKRRFWVFFAGKITKIHGNFCENIFETGIKSLSIFHAKLSPQRSWNYISVSTRGPSDQNWLPGFLPDHQKIEEKSRGAKFTKNNYKK